MLVKLTYFKPSGKFYAEGEYETGVPDEDCGWPRDIKAPPLWRIFNEVEALKDEKRLPGLIEGHSNFSVLIDVPDHPHRHPHLIPGDPMEPF